MALTTFHLLSAPYCPAFYLIKKHSEDLLLLFPINRKLQASKQALKKM